MVKVSGLYLDEEQSYGSSNLYNCTCVEDPFAQIWSHTEDIENINKIQRSKRDYLYLQICNQIFHP